nr:BglII/BstYI family type II restriction endonuclease [Aurantimonas marina]
MAILTAVHPEEFANLKGVLDGFSLNHSAFSVGGGNKSLMAKSIDSALYALGWTEKAFDTKIVVDEIEYPSPTHKVDCFKNKVALEVEWNNKDPFFDRDLNNFRLLYELRIIDLGIVVTRTTALQPVLVGAGRPGTTYGKATTHTEKLYPKIVGGGAGGCPILVFGIKPEAYVDDRTDP